VNVNRRGELWINTKEKARPVFRVVPGNRVSSEAGPSTGSGADGAAPGSDPSGNADSPARSEGRPAAEPRTVEKFSGPSGPLPTGPELLEKIRPLMRRNRRGAGGSGSLSFLSRGLKCSEADLMTAFATLGLTLPAGADDKPVQVEIGPEQWWLNKDSRGGVWINGEEKPKGGNRNAEPKDSGGEPAPAEAKATEAVEGQPGGYVQPEAATTESVLSAVRLLLKETKTGSWSGETHQLAETLGRGGDEFLAALTHTGLRIPEKPKEKPVFVEHAGEIFWLNKNAKDQLWLNAKVSKYANGDAAEKKPRRPKSKPPEG